MIDNRNIFLKKKILIYGLGKSGISSYKFLNNKARVYLFDDFSKKKFIHQQNQKIRNIKEISKIKFDRIIISPGIDVLNCKLSKFLKKNDSKIYTDLDIFYSFYKNTSITITGTNGKSTTSKILHEVLLDQNYDCRLIGNIGNPALSEKKITKNTIFVIEASSYQLDYSKLFTSKYSAILNISPDHIERHKSLKNYVNAKFKLLNYQSKESISFVKKDDLLINKKLKSKKYNPKIIKVDLKKANKVIKHLKNKYFVSAGNLENLSFVLKISETLNLNSKKLIKTLNRFKGLKYRQQIIYENKNLIIINDSKSTSFASSENLLKNLKNVYWILGGIPKKGDQLNLSKKNCNNFKTFIFGNYYKEFKKNIKNKITVKHLKYLKDILKEIFFDLKDKKIKKSIIFFSPAGASFDSFKNFEDRGKYFNQLIKKFINAK
ncbi:UDP-N-acetylmuramoyl-L-alanine--D-glutamate ligase [uncultured Candidatus Pelagibacter sp.]|jgi:UDP-N-acetylmuramoylalanine--D-glutamate ligase|uniref:UDP-N-acetylmuramoyl-L-alanine--D-glutamate ligase n=1 Tax=uncultured Candidatus Pelagibacter sp. TaxID=372654 RepID=UPI00260A2F7E|nr:UDP-N-acetylmuramoyl-L-alanine--D-glutamate ligase [uncultured Candidatus Pelagibacter sp.]